MNKLLAATLCMFVVAACASVGGKRATMAPPAPQSSGADATQPGVSPKAELERLYAQVEDEREQMQLPEPKNTGGGAAMPMSTQPHPTTTNDATCKPSPTDTCKTSCTLSDSICTNADKICKLADELKPDDDAATKCTKADDTCKSAHTKCCACM